VLEKLAKDPGDFSAEMQRVILTGLIAGAIGNVRAAVPIVINDFFRRREGLPPLIDEAQSAARAKDTAGLDKLIRGALIRNPPAGFLARTSCDFQPEGEEKPPTFREQRIPQGAHVLLALGAKPDKAEDAEPNEAQEANPHRAPGADPDYQLVFGGPEEKFMHQCVGEHLAKPLIREIVRQVLLLPGLSQSVDASGEPIPLTKEWGVMSKEYMLRYQRDRRLNQQPLFVVLPIKEPVAENVKILEALTRAGAHIVQQSLAESGIVHFAWFAIIEKKGKPCLALSTVYDGDFDAYVEYFATQVPLFDKQFEYLDVQQRTPIAQYPKEFVENIRRYNEAPLAKYFFSAYPTTSVADIENLKRASS
jgi:hypothetical protein